MSIWCSLVQTPRLRLLRVSRAAFFSVPRHSQRDSGLARCGPDLQHNRRRVVRLQIARNLNIDLRHTWKRVRSGGNLDYLSGAASDYQYERLGGPPQARHIEADD